MSNLRKLSVADLRRELERREKGGQQLVARHRKLAARLAALDAELAELGVAAPARRGRKPGALRAVAASTGRRGPRAKNSMSLLQAIMSGLRAGTTISPAEAGAAAKKAGYTTSSPHFGMMVANALAKASEFKRTGRGQYLYRGSSGSDSSAKARAKTGKPAKAKRSARKAKKPARKATRKAARKPGRAKAAPARAAKSSKPTMSPTSAPMAAAAAG